MSDDVYVHTISHRIVPFGEFFRVTVLVDGYTIDQEQFYTRIEAESWCRRQIEVLKETLRWEEK